MHDIPRREFITKSGAALATLAVFYASRHAYAFPSQAGGEVVPWLDQLPPNPVPEVIKDQLVWEDLEFLDHPQRQVLLDRPFQSAGHRREHLEA